MTEALDRLINVINDLKANVDPAVTITIDDIKVVNLAFSVTPHLGFPLQQQMSRIPGQMVRRMCNEYSRHYVVGTPDAST